MIAALLQFNHRPAIKASLPSRLLSLFKQPSRLFIFRTLSTPVPFPIAKTANFRLARTALCIFRAVLDMDIRWLDPLSTASSRTIHPVLCRVFLVFHVPFTLEGCFEKFLDVLEGNEIGCAAFGGHMSGVFDGESENAA